MRLVTLACRLSLKFLGELVNNGIGLDAEREILLGPNRGKWLALNINFKAGWRRKKAEKIPPYLPNVTSMGCR